jgi:hypothetical protein
MVLWESKFQPSTLNQKIEVPDHADTTSYLYMPSPEILDVAALVWIQLDEEPLIEVAGSRLDSLSQSQRRL